MEVKYGECKSKKYIRTKFMFSTLVTLGYYEYAVTTIPHSATNAGKSSDVSG